MDRAAHRRAGRRLLYAAVAAGVLCALASPVHAQPPVLPFAPGESCVYRASGPLGRVGSGTFAVQRGDGEGAGNWLLRFDIRGRVGPAVVENHSRSWFDPDRVASVRFSKTERSPVSSSREEVRMDAESGRWTGADGGQGGEMPTRAPLDELSFIYFLRTLRLADGEMHSLARHFDAARGPVRVRVVGRAPVRVPAGEFRAVQVEMRVPDPRRYGGEGVILIHFSDDARHVPLRIDSRIPRAGHMVLTLEALTPACGGTAVAARANR
ncbi:MAG TPA: DUF3108 domain-containing protein [Longimicrobium sp.]|jgi:hypothetical protein|uniref:DUF3108 domain-containing protein n=1 Tax=Longimicrobium sp. TaxID=2029185 RepID=UPI002ED8FFE0